MIEAIKDTILIITGFFDLITQLVLFVPNPFRNIILFYLSVFIGVLIYKKVRGES